MSLSKLSPWIKLSECFLQWVSQVWVLVSIFVAVIWWPFSAGCLCEKHIAAAVGFLTNIYEKKRRRKSGPWVNQNTVGINGGDSRKHHLQKVSHTPLMEKRKCVSNPSKQLRIEKSEDSNSPNLVSKLDFFQTKKTGFTN